jgi:hypothetical protein
MVDKCIAIFLNIKYFYVNMLMNPKTTPGSTGTQYKIFYVIILMNPEAKTTPGGTGTLYRVRAVLSPVFLNCLLH